MNFVPKTANPLNCLELRVIEKCWAIIKQKIKKLCRNIKDLIRRKKHQIVMIVMLCASLWGPPKQKFEILLLIK